MIAGETEEIDEHLSPRSLVSIEVEQLFGTFTYELRANQNEGKILILYGDNGSGKSTILECIYHLLSPADNEGHRTFLTRVPFRKLSVTLTGGWSLIVQRATSAKGNYALICTEPGNLAPHTFTFDAEKRTFIDRASVGGYSAFLRRLGLELFFLRADRTFNSDSHAQARRAARRWMMHESKGPVSLLEAGEVRLDGEDERQLLSTVIASANDYLRRKASRAANAGTASANSVYEEVLRTIVHSAQPLDDFLEPSRESLEQRLEILGERSKGFSRFSLTAPFNAADLIQVIREAPSTSLPLIASVLEPHLDSVTTRLDALASIQALIESLVEDLNAFFTHKQVRFKLSSGIQIITTDGTVLSPELLSSGEKHLLQMFCHTIVAHGRRTLFIIDEPEISLNVKWQHRIVERLLDIVKDSPTQFIFATHSIELLSQRLDSVVRLIPLSEELDRPADRDA